jgi:hypothetical protein
MIRLRVEGEGIDGRSGFSAAKGEREQRERAPSTSDHSTKI